MWSQRDAVALSLRPPLYTLERMGSIGWMAGVAGVLLGCGSGDTAVPTSSESSAGPGTTTDPGSESASETGTQGAIWSDFTKFPEREFRGQIFDGAWVASDPCAQGWRHVPHVLHLRRGG